jgi:hypothetical protein
MNVYKCSRCGHTYSDDCHACGYGQPQALGDIHLGSLGVVAYVEVIGNQLIIKKPSGQVNVQLQPQDLIKEVRQDESNN